MLKDVLYILGNKNNLISLEHWEAVGGCRRQILWAQQQTYTHRKKQEPRRAGTTHSKQLISLKIHPKETSADTKQNRSYIYCLGNTELGDMAPTIQTCRVYRSTKTT